MNKIKSKRISSGVSQIGGKFRSVNTITALIPYHEFYLEPFLGAGWILLNKPRCRYECGNDLNSELINYLLVIREYPKEFDELKQGVFGLVSQEICNRIVRGELQPRNNIERAYFYYYLNKLTFGGGIWMVRKNPPMKGIDPTDQAGKFDIEVKKHSYIGLIDNQTMSRSGYGRVDSKEVVKAKEEYELQVDKFSYIGIGREGITGDMSKKKADQAKAQYRGMTLPTVCKDKSVNDAKSSYRGITPKNAQYGGLIDCGNVGGSAYGKMPRNRDLHIYKNSYKQATHKGLNPKTTRPYTNNDCGLLSPIQPEAIKRLRYVNLTTYPFQKVYKMFYEAFHVRKGLGPECFVYFDPPYPGTEKHYRSGFGLDDHKALIEIILKSPFHVMLSIGGNCELYLDKLKGLFIKPVDVRYSTDANSQKKSREYIITNYDIKKLPLMRFESKQKTLLECLK